MRCFCCKGPYHEATGHIMRGFEDVVYCGACARHFLPFFKGQMSRKWSKGDFYHAAHTSIREGVFPPVSHPEGFVFDDQGNTRTDLPDTPVVNGEPSK